MQNYELKEKALAKILEHKNICENISEKNLYEALKDRDIKNLYVNGKDLLIKIGYADAHNKSSVSLRKEFLKNKKLLQNLLNEKGFLLQNLKPNYLCKKCKDTGKINGKDCSCLNKEISKILQEECGLTCELPCFENVSFSIIKNEKQKNYTSKIYQLLEDYTKNLKSTKKPNVTIFGNVGVGKTYLLKCVVNKSVELGYFTIFTTAFNLNQKMLEFHLAPIDKKRGILEPYLSCDLLIIDDLGTENKIKNVTLEYLYLIINERYMQNKNTIITTNIPIENISSVYDERIFSRIANKQNTLMVNMSGADLRLDLDDED